MDVKQFDYHPPSELIAQTPAEPRDTSRLMVVNRATGQISHHTFANLGQFLQAGDIMVVNDSRVIPARLFGCKQTGGKVEILLLKQRDSLQWEALVGGKRLKPGVVVNIEGNGASISLTIQENLGEARRLIAFNQPVNAHLSQVGHLPLPPYIHTSVDDDERYQTVFSRIEGSSAAPTAGLHFIYPQYVVKTA